MMPRFVAAGEALTDMVRVGPDSWRSHPGGSVWNVARAMAALGVPSAFAGAVSRDLFGDALADASRAAGLDPRFLQRVARPPLLALVHELDPPAYFFVGADSADLHFDPERLPSGWEDALAWVHFGGISLARAPLAGRLLALGARLKARGARISYDPNFRLSMDETYDATLARMAALADLIKVSDEDLCGLFRCADADAALARLRAFNPGAAILHTHGGAGATLHLGGKSWSAPAPAVAVVDTVGAGDASLAGLLSSMMTRPERAPDAHLRQAMAAGAAACMVQGAAPPRQEAVARLLACAEGN